VLKKGKKVRTMGRAVQATATLKIVGKRSKNVKTENPL